MASHGLSCLAYHVYEFYYQGDFMVWDVCSSCSHQFQSRQQENRKWREEQASPVKDTSQEAPIPSVSVPLTRNWFHGLNIQKEGSKCHLYREIHASSRLLEVLSLWKERRVGSGGRLATLGAVPTLRPLHCVNDSVHERNTCLLKTTRLLHTIHLGSQ